MSFNGDWVKWVVVALLPLVLAGGIWLGNLENRVSANEKTTDQVKAIDKKVTQILCVVKPETCL